MALPPSLVHLPLLLAIVASISFLILFLKRRRRGGPKSNLKQNHYQPLQELQERHPEQEEAEEEEEEESPAAWLLTPPPATGERAAESPAGGDAGVGEEKRRKKKGKKKQRPEVAEAAAGGCPERDRAAAAAAKAGNLFPFSSFASATQRKIKAQYDALVKSNQAKQLTMAQVGQFVNCLVDARNELQHKSEIIQRSFKIKKALLVKADRSSFDRLCQQVYKLETEHKRLEEDAAVYNLLQEQLKLSPAYKTMLEVGANMELKGSQDEAVDMDFCDISFEELLAQEKKDSFWQRNGRLRSFAS